MRRIPKEERPRLLIAGDGPAHPAVKKHLSSEDLVVEFRGPFTTQDLPNLLSEIDVMFAMYDPRRGNIEEGAVPVKMFDAASFGRPSLVNAGVPMAEICRTERLGSAVPWGNAESLAAAIQDQIGKQVLLKVTESRERERFLGALAPFLS